MKIDDSESLQNAYLIEANRIGLRDSDARLIYERCVSPFGNEIAERIDIKYLPNIIRLAKKDCPDKTKDKINIQAFKIQKEFWCWLLCEEIITMQDMFDPEMYDDSESRRSMDIIKSYCGDMDKINNTRQSEYFYFDAPREDFRLLLDNAQFLIRSLSLRFKFMLNPDKNICLLDSSIIKAGIDFKFDTGLLFLPACEFRNLPTLCAIRWCLYLESAIKAAESNPNLEKPLNGVIANIWDDPKESVWEW